MVNTVVGCRSSEASHPHPLLSAEGGPLEDPPESPLEALPEGPAEVAAAGNILASYVMWLHFLCTLMYYATKQAFLQTMKTN